MLSLHAGEHTKDQRTSYCSKDLATFAEMLALQISWSVDWGLTSLGVLGFKLPTPKGLGGLGGLGGHKPGEGPGMASPEHFWNLLKRGPSRTSSISLSLSSCPSLRGRFILSLLPSNQEYPEADTPDWKWLWL